MALEAIERVKKAEDDAQLYEQKVKKEMLAYEEERNKELTDWEKQSKSRVLDALTHEEQKATEELALYQEELNELEQTQLKTIEERFAANKKHLLSYLMERMTTHHGSK